MRTRDGRLSVEALRPEDPAEIGGYPVLARIGAGGMGQVYLGVTGGGRHVALKVIRGDFDGPQALARFRREVRTVERVRSRFAAAMVGAGLDAPPYWLATEYVPGPTLRQAVAEHGPLPPETCLRLLAALAQGLLELHGQGVQHRDLKPGNVILAPDGPRLIDFGIARGEDQTQITRTGAWNGTPGYVAPEVVREQHPVPASDVFSLAGTIAYAATGRPPFGGGRIEAVLHRTLSGDIDVAGADARVAELVALCAAKDPADRPTPERLIRLADAPGALAGDPAYRAVVGAPPPVPGSLAAARAAGLAPAGRSTLTGRTGGRPGAAVLGAAAAVVAVVLVVALAVRFAMDGRGDDGAGGNRTSPPAGATTGRTAGTGGTTAGNAPKSPGGSSPADTGGRPPDRILLKNPTDDYDSVAWTHANSRCQPDIRAEDENLAADLQVGAPRQPVTVKTAELTMRFKYARKKGYYVAAEVRPPVGLGGNTITGIVRSRPVLLPSNDDYATLHYPADFTWPGSGNEAFDLAEGDWTVIWLHVRSNGDAYYLGCDGFTAA